MSCRTPCVVSSERNFAVLARPDLLFGLQGEISNELLFIDEHGRLVAVTGSGGKAIVIQQPGSKLVAIGLAANKTEHP